MAPPCNKSNSSLTKKELIAKLKENKTKLEEKEAKLEEYKTEIEENKTKLDEKEAKLEENKAAKLEEYKAVMEENKVKLEEYKAKLKEKELSLKKVEETVNCCVCLSVPRDTRIPVCVNGHVICAKCNSGRATCPVCRADKAGERFSVVAGNIADLLEVECANLELGCNAKLLRPSLVEHEASCIYTRNIKCPNAELYRCKLNVSVANCVEHLKNTCRYLGGFGRVELGVPTSVPLKFKVPISSDGWAHSAYTMNVSGTDDNIIMVGLNSGDYSLASFKCLSADRSRRYKLKIKLVDNKSGQSKSNVGETLLMTENLGESVRFGNVLEIHSKAFRQFKEGGMAEILVTLNKKTETKRVEALGEVKPGTKRKVSDNNGRESSKKSK